MILLTTVAPDQEVWCWVTHVYIAGTTPSFFFVVFFSLVRRCVSDSLCLCMCVCLVVYYLLCSSLSFDPLFFLSSLFFFLFFALFSLPLYMMAYRSIRLQYTLHFVLPFLTASLVYVEKNVLCKL